MGLFSAIGDAVGSAAGSLGLVGLGALGPVGGLLGYGIGSQQDASAEAKKAAAVNFENNAWMQQQAQQFEERMSNSAYQRAVADMEKAGINPMLAISQGGASSPSLGVGHVESVAPTLAKIREQAVSSVRDSAYLHNEMRKTKSTVDLQASEKAHADRMAEQAAASVKQIEAQTRLSNLEAQKVASELPAIRAEANVRKAHGDIDTKMAVPDAIGQRVGKVADKAVNMLGLGAILRYAKRGWQKFDLVDRKKYRGSKPKTGYGDDNSDF